MIFGNLTRNRLLNCKFDVFQFAALPNKHTMFLLLTCHTTSVYCRCETPVFACLHISWRSHVEFFIDSSTHENQRHCPTMKTLQSISDATLLIKDLTKNVSDLFVEMSSQIFRLRTAEPKVQISSDLHVVPILRSCHTLRPLDSSTLSNSSNDITLWSSVSFSFEHFSIPDRFWKMSRPGIAQQFASRSDCCYEFLSIIDFVSFWFLWLCFHKWLCSLDSPLYPKIRPHPQFSSRFVFRFMMENPLFKHTSQECVA